MASTKRSWDEANDSDEDEPLMGRQTLPVARLPEDFDGIPKDGMQYLFMVRRDARKLPHITRVQNPHVLPGPNVEPKASCPSIRVKLPSEEWRTTFLKRFKNFRINSTQATIGVELPPSSILQGPKRMPEKKERNKWWAFINGRSEYEWNPPKRQKNPRSRCSKGMRSWDDSFDDLNQYEVHYEEEGFEPQETIVVTEHGEVITLPTPQPDDSLDEYCTELIQQSARAPTTLQRSRQPTPSLLKSMDSGFCTHLLMYFSYWIEQHLKYLDSSQPLPYPLSSFSTSPFARLTKTHARWMFCLLSRVEENISSDEMSNLRTLARACLSVIKDLNKDHHTDRASGELASPAGGASNWSENPADAPIDEQACWIVFAAISDFWGQKDLWMDAENLFSGT